MSHRPFCRHGRGIKPSLMHIFAVIGMGYQDQSSSASIIGITQMVVEVHCFDASYRKVLRFDSYRGSRDEAERWF